MSSFSLTSLYLWPRKCTPQARETVLSIINSSQTPLTTRDIYKRAVKPARANTPGPRTGEAIRSMRYLKTVVLPALVAQNKVEKVRVTDGFTAWLWQSKPAPLASKPKVAAHPTKTTSGASELTPAAVGVGEDWSHLNKRRQRSRERKVERDLQRMLEVQKAQRQAPLQH